MARTKTQKSKKSVTKNIKKGSTKPVVKGIEEKEEEIDIIVPGTPKKGLGIDVADILPDADEKIEDESPALTLEDEDGEDGVGLDVEDLNPFGDKWEE